MTGESRQLVPPLTLKEVSRVLNLKRDAILERVKDKRLKAYLDGRAYRFRSEDVQDYIDNLKEA